MVSFLFWNLNRKDISNIVTNIVLLYDIDIIMLAECEIDPSILLSKLNRYEVNYNYATGIIESKIKIFIKFSEEFLNPIYDDDRTTIKHLRLPLKDDILLAITHFQSKYNFDSESQALECATLSDYIKLYENEIGHKRTILVGDLNMNPFESGVVGAKGLHAVMAKSIARSGKRQISGRSYPYFYNPMWGFFGDNTRGPPGTYYYRRSQHVAFFWNIFDQVMIRPELLDKFKNEDLYILDNDGERSLLSRRGLPEISDHLPIMFKIDLG